MNPRNLNAHVERAIRQSGNEQITGIKVISANQLKSGDLSVARPAVARRRPFAHTQRTAYSGLGREPRSEIRRMACWTPPASAHAPQRRPIFEDVRCRAESDGAHTMHL